MLSSCQFLQEVSKVTEVPQPHTPTKVGSSSFDANGLQNLETLPTIK